MTETWSKISTRGLWALPSFLAFFPTLEFIFQSVWFVFVPGLFSPSLYRLLKVSRRYLWPEQRIRIQPDNSEIGNLITDLNRLDHWF